MDFGDYFAAGLGAAIVRTTRWTWFWALLFGPFFFFYKGVFWHFAAYVLPMLSIPIGQFRGGAVRRPHAGLDRIHHCGAGHRSALLPQACGRGRRWPLGG
jgi:hypothetical protein